MYTKVHPKSWAKVDSQFKDAVTNWFAITKVAKSQPVDAAEDTRLRRLVAQCADPLLERRFSVTLDEDAKDAFFRLHVKIVA